MGIATVHHAAGKAARPHFHACAAGLILIEYGAQRRIYQAERSNVNHLWATPGGSIPSISAIHTTNAKEIPWLSH
jgi:hypothetical protein